MAIRIDELFEYCLKMHHDGFMTERQVARDFIKFIADYGDQKDFDALPFWVQEEICKRIEEYKMTRSWTILTSEGTIDMAEAAELFIRRIKI
ncbi:hypothetical protein [Metapseudomonas otitidis]|uniref:hypothetical protein n=1 Tax=Metapseudomonas otitidis TaxID=319939 RepID=UPI0013F5F9C2|nr:hypothetical protein [Pseudomonas otitidis]